MVEHQPIEKRHSSCKVPHPMNVVHVAMPVVMPTNIPLSHQTICTIVSGVSVLSVLLPRHWDKSPSLFVGSQTFIDHPLYARDWWFRIILRSPLNMSSVSGYLSKHLPWKLSDGALHLSPHAATYSNRFYPIHAIWLVSLDHAITFIVPLDHLFVFKFVMCRCKDRWLLIL